MLSVKISVQPDRFGDGLDLRIQQTDGGSGGRKPKKHIKDYIQGGSFVIEEKDQLEMSRQIEEAVKEILEPDEGEGSNRKKL